jgi:PKD domain
MMSEELKRDRKAVSSVAGVAGASQERIGRVLATILILLLGVGFMPASASAAPSSAVAPQSVAPSPTRLLGFNQAPATVRVGGQLADAVAVLPKAARTVYVQYRRAGTTRFTTSSSQRTSAQGSLTAYLMPPAAGTWQFRLVVVATARAKALVSPLRTVKASGIATTTKILGFASTPATITVGAIVRDAVSVSPRASRTVEVQARRAGTATWVNTSTSGGSSAVGSFMAIYRPAPGVWQYRLMVRASATARTAVSPPRTVTARPSPGVITPPGTPIPPDTTAPGPVTALTATVATDSSITLSWANPTDLDFTGVTIRRLVGDVAPATATDGTAVTLPASATSTSFTDTGLTTLTLYSYALFAHDNAANYAAAANVTGRTTGTPPGPTTTPVLSIGSSGVDTTTITVGGSLLCVASDTYAGPGVTLTSVVLDYGDNSAQTIFNGDQASWFEAHSYSSPGKYPVTLTVTDSANVTVSKVVTVTVFPVPTAAITIEGNPTSVHAGSPVTFTLASSTPPGTATQSWSVYGDWLDGGYGTTPPATVTHTFSEPGTYTVQFNYSNDAKGTAESSMEVTVVP